MRETATRIAGRLRRMGRRLFVPREILLRAEGRVHYLTLSPRLQMAGAALLLALAGWLAAGSLLYLASRIEMAGLDREVRLAKADAGRAEAARLRLLGEVAEHQQRLVALARSIDALEAAAASGAADAEPILDGYLAALGAGPLPLPAAAGELADKLQRLGRDLSGMIALNLTFARQIAVLQREALEAERKQDAAHETSRYLATQLEAARTALGRSDERQAVLTGRVAALEGEIAALRRQQQQAIAQSQRLQSEAMRVAEKAGGEGEAERTLVAAKAADYPFRKLWAGNAPEDALVLAVMQHESAFRTAAISPAGARGIMQLMPATAEYVAGRLKLGYHESKLIAEPDFNITLGRAYLHQLLQMFDGSYVLAIAAYNAGPTRVLEWIERFGDPRRKDVDSRDWIARIPFGETRAYVRRVMKSLDAYRHSLTLAAPQQCTDRAAKAFLASW